MTVHNEQKTLTQTSLIIWFAILSGLFIILEFIGGGVGRLTEKTEIQSLAWIALGLIPLIIGAVGRGLLLPKADPVTTFLPTLVISLALCEMVAIVAILIIPKALNTEVAIIFTCSVLGILMLCPLGIKNTNLTRPPARRTP